MYSGDALYRQIWSRNEMTRIEIEHEPRDSVTDTCDRTVGGVGHG